LIAERCRDPTRFPFRRHRHLRKARHDPGRNLRQRHHPLPPEQPDPSGRRDPDGVARQCAGGFPGVVQIREPGSRRAQYLKKQRNIPLRRAPEPLAHRFADDPPAEISGPAAAVLKGRPIVVRGRDRRVPPMGERPGFGGEPPVVGRIRRSDESERPTERVDHLLSVPMLRRMRIGPPAPIRRQLPVGQVGGENGRDRVVGHRTKKYTTGHAIVAPVAASNLVVGRQPGSQSTVRSPCAAERPHTRPGLARFPPTGPRCVRRYCEPGCRLSTRILAATGGSKFARPRHEFRQLQSPVPSPHGTFVS
jgi:hypothetical protein